MSLKPTSLYIQAAQLPPTFSGGPNDLFTAMIQRMKIVSPSGTNFIFIGDNEPTSNVGPWLKGGTKWFVWDETTKRYVPVDVSESVDIPFHIGATTPLTSTPPVWLRTTADATDVSPSYGSPIGWYMFDGAAWTPYVGIVLSGPTASRPASPVEYQQFYDTEITCLLWWERSKWRTVAGVPGDVKAVSFNTADDALTHNPGWDIFGAANQALRGRIIMQATTDTGASPATDLTVDTGLEKRVAFEVFGEDTKIQINAASPLEYPGQLALWHIVKS
jgi:hypothetical protein